MNSDFYEKLSTIVSAENVIENEMMSRHTTFRTGGPADYFVRVNTIEELSSLMALFKELHMELLKDVYVVGNGSNLLVSDKGFKGVILCLDGDFCDVSLKDKVVTAGAAAINAKVANLARDNGLTGFEFAHGIPGTIGGALIMNAGAYGGEMKQVVRKVRVMESDGTIKTVEGQDLEFGYRTSLFKGKPLVILDTEIELTDGDSAEIDAVMKDLMERRRTKQPLEYPSAGSTFKRPEGYFAGKLIEEAGLRGYSNGDAQVSEKHCGFVINKGKATSSDIYKLICDVQNKVKENSGIELQPEVIKLGDFEV
ncbi:MAG: UDP-N-acetylmuramate dehydrogenase [Butyrivibrio sp.]|nr:UDP-N-acetylmuramate dehydrogenase [Butyrivibrio sp.]